MSKPTIPKQIHNYNIMKELGHGSFATVCKAFNKLNRRTYAMKVLPKEKLQGQTEIERFQREVNSSAYLRHESLVALHDFFWDEKNFYLVLDFCPGGELFDYIVQHDRLDEDVAAVVFKQIVDAVAYCHDQGVAHRDLKPENVLIEKWPKVKVSDFGLCGYIRPDELMKTFCGSPLYCAPECLGKTEYDGRLSDVWSLGVILFVMVTGDNPWKYENMSQMINEIMTGNYKVPDYVSDDCRDLICGMMRVVPSVRITVADILEHPWLKLAEKANLKKGKLGMSELPPLRGMSVEEFGEMSKDKSQQSSHGIYSPFEEVKEPDESEDGEPMKLGRSRMPSLPQLCVRSGSFERLSSTQKLQLPRRIVNTNLSLAGNRQRSATLLAGARRRPCPLPPMAMDTIEE